MNNQKKLRKKLYDELFDSYSDDHDEWLEIKKLFDGNKFSELLDNYDVQSVRICSECGKLLDKGYCVNGGVEHYCSDECLHKNYNEEEYDNMYNDGLGESYYTEY